MITVSRSSAIRITLTLITLLFGCNPTSELVESGTPPGDFSLTWLKGLRKYPSTENLPAPAMAQETAFNLGDVNGSTDFYFLVRNIGGSTITGISISVSDSSFLVFPSSMDSLSPGSSLNLEHLSELPLLRLSAIHGPSPLPLMSAGPHSTYLEIHGQTLREDGSAQEVDLVARMDINALLMDAVVWDGSTMVDLLDSDGAILVGGFVVTDFVQAYQIADTARIQNTGNVPLYLTVFAAGLEDTLSPGDWLTLDHGVNTHIRFNSGGIVRDLSRYPTYSDGQAYIYLFWQW